MSQAEITVSLVKDLKELEECYAIRREVFMVEGDEPEEEQFDGNDFCAAHLLAYWKGKPAGTMRLRIVSAADGGTIIWERFAILKDVREKNPWMFRAMLNNARRYTELMGLKNVVGIVENPKLMRFWKLYGGKLTGEAPVVYRGHEYKPVRLVLDGKEGEDAQVTLRQALQTVPDVFAENGAPI